MKKILNFIFLVSIILLKSLLFGNVGSITGITMTPSSPLNGASVQISWNYTITNNNENPKALVLISDSTTLRNANTSGQWLMMDQNWPTAPNPMAQANNGYQVNSNVSVGSYSAGPYTFTLPADLIPGVTYYIIVAMSNNYLGLYNDHTDQVQVQGFSASFVLPLPAPAASIVKTAENSTAQPGDKILFTLNYNYVNATNFTISDIVPAECTLVSQSTGGVAAGSTITWNTASVAGPAKSGSVWFIATVNNGTPSGTVIHNTAHWVIDEIPGGGDSNDATVTLGSPFTLLKTQNSSAPGIAAIGEAVTYSFDFHAGGMSFSNFAPFDSNISGFTAVSNGGPGYTGTWNWVSDGAGGGYLSSPQQGTGPTNDHYPHYLANTADDFCYGEIQADISIGNGTTNWDGMITFRDSGTPDNAIAYGIGISQDGTPGHLYLQKSVPAYTPLTAANPISINFDTWYTVKIRVTDTGTGGVRLQARVWLAGTTDPGVWAIDYTDNTGVIPGCGKVGFQGCPSNPDKFDNLKIFSANQSNPRLFDTLPTQLTYVGGTAADTTHGGPVFAGGMVKWNIFTSLTDVVYHLETWATVNYCGMLYNTASFDTDEVSPQIDSNTTTLNVAICPQTPTFTPTFTYSPTSTYTLTATPTYTATMTYTYTYTYTATMTATPTFTMTNTPIIPQFTIVKSVVPGSAKIGDIISYNIHYTNTGNIALTNFEVWDTLPAQLENIANVSVPGIYNPANGVIDWILATVPINASGDFSFTATLKDVVTRNQVISNKATGYAVMANSAVESNVANVTANVPELQLTPVTNYPNPFEGETTIVFGLTVAADCKIKFFTISGEFIGELDNIKGVTGTNKVVWEGINKAGNKLASGIYFYRIDAVRGSEKQHCICRLAIMR